MGYLGGYPVAAGLTADDYLMLLNDPTGTPAVQVITAANANTYLGGGGGGSSIVTIVTKTASYTAVLADVAETMFKMNVATANTFTLPPNSSAAIVVGTPYDIVQYGAGATTVTPGSGVTLRSRGGLLVTAGQYAVASVLKIGTDEWLVGGDLT